MEFADILERTQRALTQALEWGVPRAEQAWDGMASSGTIGIDGNAALLLLAGGLTILAFTVPLALLRARLSGHHETVPPRSVEFDEPPPPDRSLPTPAEVPLAEDPAFLEGSNAGERAVDPKAGLDAALDALDAAGLGTPRIRSCGSKNLVIELNECEGCPEPELAHVGRVIAPNGCAYEAGFLEGSLRRAHADGVRVNELECVGWGDRTCVFEVRR